jgi:hypothetical protein
VSISKALPALITRNAFTQSSVQGRHFELMDEPNVRKLAQQINQLLKLSPAAEPVSGSPNPPRLVAEKSIKPRLAALRRP